MARTVSTTTTTWQNVGTGPAVLTVKQHVANSVLFINSSATDASAHAVTYTPHPHMQIDFRSTEDIYIKSDVAGWKIIVDTDGQ